MNDCIQSPSNAKKVVLYDSDNLKGKQNGPEFVVRYKPSGLSSIVKWPQILIMALAKQNHQAEYSLTMSPENESAFARLLLG